MATPEALLFSDFDGTAVVTVPKWDPRNWLKYPLDMQPGYDDFLDGMVQTGVQLDSIVSVRPDIAPRRWVTDRSMRELGLTDYFEDVHLTGKERAKAAVIVDRADTVGVQNVGMIDDRLRIAAALIDVLNARPDEQQLDVTLGVVPGKYHEQDPTDWLTTIALDAAKHEIDITGCETHANDAALVFAGTNFIMTLVAVEAYTEQEGRLFAGQLQRT